LGKAVEEIGYIDKVNIDVGCDEKEGEESESKGYETAKAIDAPFIKEADAERGGKGIANGFENAKGNEKLCVGNLERIDKKHRDNGMHHHKSGSTDEETDLIM
jgi:hypothetical protein